MSEACMGGFMCPRRDACDFYVNGPQRRETPRDRMCPPGRENPAPIRVRQEKAEPGEWTPAAPARK